MKEIFDKIFGGEKKDIVKTPQENATQQMYDKFNPNGEMDKMTEDLKQERGEREKRNKEIIDKIIKEGGFENATIEDKIEFLENKRDEYKAQFSEEEWDRYDENYGRFNMAIHKLEQEEKNNS